MTRIKAKFINLAGKKFNKMFEDCDYPAAVTKMEQFIEDKKDVILDDYEEA